MPKKGLNVPVMTVLDDGLNIIEDEQRKLIRYVIQDGRGAGSLFICGTTGEFNRLSREQRRQLIEIGVDEIGKEDLRLGLDKKIQAWVGVTGATRAETLDDLRLAISLGADMAVIAPMAIGDLDPSDAPEFFRGEVRSVLRDAGYIDIGLYENPDIALHDDNGGLLTFDAVREITEMPFVACAKASVDQATLTAYLKEFAVDGDLDLKFYFGNAPMVFEMKNIQRDAGLAESPVLVAGVVSGTGNIFPAEWEQAWKWTEEGRDDLNDPMRRAFDALVGVTTFQGYGGSESKLLGGMKQALYRLGVISNPKVAAGTPELTAEEAKAIDAGLERALAILDAEVDPQYRSHVSSSEATTAA